MKIAFLTPEFVTEENWHGGLANYLKRVTEGLASREHDVSVFVLSDKNEKLKFGKVYVYRIKFNKRFFSALNFLSLKKIPLTLKSLILSFQLCRSFHKIDKEIDFDVIQSSSYFTPGIFLFSKKDRTRLITRISSLTKLWADAYNKRDGCDLFFVNWLELKMLKISTAKYAPSVVLQEILSKDFHVEVDLVEPPYYFSETDEDKVFFDKKIKGKKYFLFFGSLGRLKGVDLIAEAIYNFFKKNPNAYFVFIGKDLGVEGKPSVDLLMKMAGEFSSRIIYSESLPHSKLIPVIKNAKAVVLPSRIDNLPNTLIESMSLGKIVLGTFEGGFCQLINHGENGFIFSVGEKKKMDDLLDKIFNLKDRERFFYERKAKETITEKLNFEDRLKDLESYFQDIIEKNK